MTLDKLLNNSELQFPLCNIGGITVPPSSVVRIKSYISSKVLNKMPTGKNSVSILNVLFFYLNNLMTLGKEDLAPKFGRKANLICEYYFPNYICFLCLFLYTSFRLTGVRNLCH